MNFLADNLFDIVALGVTLFVTYNFWYEYFSNKNKMSDEQLFDNFITLERRKQKSSYRA